MDSLVYLLLSTVQLIDISQSKFEGNRGPLELIETIAQIVNSTFMSNVGSYRCIFHDTDYGCLSGVAGSSTGGAIIATNSTVDIKQSKFEDNGADFGGAILAEQNSIISLSGNIFVNNNAAFNGGVLYSSNVQPYHNTSK